MLNDLNSARKLRLLLSACLHRRRAAAAPRRPAIHPLQIRAPKRNTCVQAIDILRSRGALRRELLLASKSAPSTLTNTHWIVRRTLRISCSSSMSAAWSSALSFLGASGAKSGVPSSRVRLCTSSSCGVSPLRVSVVIALGVGGAKPPVMPSGVRSNGQYQPLTLLLEASSENRSVERTVLDTHEELGGRHF